MDISKIILPALESDFSSLGQKLAKEGSVIDKFEYNKQEDLSKMIEYLDERRRKLDKDQENLSELQAACSFAQNLRTNLNKMVDKLNSMEDFLHNKKKSKILPRFSETVCLNEEGEFYKAAEKVAEMSDTWYYSGNDLENLIQQSKQQN